MIIALIISHLGVLLTGIAFGPKIEAFWKALSVKKAVSDAKKLIAKAEADAVKLDSAKKLVASQPSPTGVTGKASGPTGG